MYANEWFKRPKKDLPDGELNPGLPRDRRGYWPLYYRGYYRRKYLTIFPYFFVFGQWSFYSDYSDYVNQDKNYFQVLDFGIK